MKQRKVGKGTRGVAGTIVLLLAVGAGTLVAGCSSERADAGEPEARVVDDVFEHDGAAVEMTVYKSPTCGCCTTWVGHAEQHGFVATIVDDNAQDVTKDGLGVPRALWGCHTAVVGEHIFEGHVPADLIRKFLSEDSDMVGLAVPGMPMGSPGMEANDPRMHENYDIIAFDREGNTRVYARR